MIPSFYICQVSVSWECSRSLLKKWDCRMWRLFVCMCEDSYLYPTKYKISPALYFTSGYTLIRPRLPGHCGIEFFELSYGGYAEKPEVTFMVDFGGGNHWSVHAEFPPREPISPKRLICFFPAANSKRVSDMLPLDSACQENPASLVTATCTFQCSCLLSFLPFLFLPFVIFPCYCVYASNPPWILCGSN